MQLLRGTHNPFHFGATDRILVELCVDTSKFSGFVFVRNRIRGNDANLCNVKDAPSDIEALCWFKDIYIEIYVFAEEISDFEQ